MTIAELFQEDWAKGIRESERIAQNIRNREQKSERPIELSYKEFNYMYTRGGEYTQTTVTRLDGEKFCYQIVDPEVGTVYTHTISQRDPWWDRGVARTLGVIE